MGALVGVEYDKRPFYPAICYESVEVDHCLQVNYYPLKEGVASLNAEGPCTEDLSPRLIVRRFGKNQENFLPILLTKEEEDEFMDGIFRDRTIGCSIHVPQLIGRLAAKFNGYSPE